MTKSIPPKRSEPLGSIASEDMHTFTKFFQVLRDLKLAKRKTIFEAYEKFYPWLETYQR